jgi:hypothetical protein
LAESFDIVLSKSVTPDDVAAAFADLIPPGRIRTSPLLVWK